MAEKDTDKIKQFERDALKLKEEGITKADKIISDSDAIRTVGLGEMATTEEMNNSRIEMNKLKAKDLELNNIHKKQYNPNKVRAISKLLDKYEDFRKCYECDETVRDEIKKYLTSNYSLEDTFIKIIKGLCLVVKV